MGLRDCEPSENGQMEHGYPFFPLWGEDNSFHEILKGASMPSKVQHLLVPPSSVLSPFVSYGGCEGSSLVLERDVVLGVMLRGWAFYIIQWS